MKANLFILSITVPFAIYFFGSMFLWLFAGMELDVIKMINCAIFLFPLGLMSVLVITKGDI